MARGIIPPNFPVAPREYDIRYMNEIVRSFTVFLQQINNPGPWRASSMTLTGLKNNDVGLEIGALFQQEGFVKIVLANKPHPAGTSATGSLGSVTVTTT